MTFMQAPSLKFPISSRPPESPFLVLTTGLIDAMLKDLTVLVRSFLLEERAYNPSLLRIK